MWYHHLSEQSNIGVTQLGGNTTEFSNLPTEMKVYILKKTFGSNPVQVASGLANIEKISTGWRNLALTELWKLAAKELFNPQQLENARNHLFQQFNREPSWKEIYLSLITRTVRMASEQFIRASEASPLYIPAGSSLRILAENYSSNTKMSYSILYKQTSYTLVLDSSILGPYKKINKIIPINVSRNYTLELYCEIQMQTTPCNGFAKMTPF